MRSLVSVGVNVDHDGADVIFAPALVRQVNQSIARFLRTALLAERLEQILRPHHLPQPIGTEQEDIAGAHNLMENVYLDTFMTGAQGTINQVTLGVGIDILRGNLVRLYEPRHKGMIAR